MKNTDVMIWGEIVESKLDPNTLELLGVGKTLAEDTGGRLHLLLIGEGISKACERIHGFGTNRVYIIEGPEYRKFNADYYSETIQALCGEKAPGIFLMPHSTRSLEIAPRLAELFNTLLITDCIGLEIDPEDGLLRCIKPVTDDNAEAVYKYDKRPQIATVRAGIFPPIEDLKTECNIVKANIQFSSYTKNNKFSGTHQRECGGS